jgi:uncharacterized membrane protein
MLTTITAATSSILVGAFGAAAVVSLILFLIIRELASAHAEETWSWTSERLAKTLLVPILPLLVVFAFVVAMKVLEVL